MKKSLVLSLLVITTLSLSSFGDVIEWGSASEVLFGKDGETLLPQADNPQNAGFIQLLYLGETGTHDYSISELADIGGDGTLGNDEVIAQSWVGEQGAPFHPDGTFTATDQPFSDPYVDPDDNFAIRVFDTPSPGYGDGFVWNEAGDDYTFQPGDIPTSGYYNYIEFIDPEKDADNRYNFVIEDPFSTTIGGIPEPSSFVLITLAGLILAFRRHRCGACK